MLYRNGQEEVHIQNITPIAGYHFLYQENKRMITSSIILIVIFLVTISPVIVQIIVYQLDPELPSMEFFRVSFSFGGLRHCLNPYIYMIRSPKFWQSVNNIFPFLRERQRRRVQAENAVRIQKESFKICFDKNDGVVDTEIPSSTRETVVYTRETVGCTRETVGLTRETMGSTRETVGSTRVTVGCTRETVGYTRETVGCTRETVGCTRETVGYTRETSSIEMVDIEIMNIAEDDSMGEASGAVPVSDVFSIS